MGSSPVLHLFCSEQNVFAVNTANETAVNYDYDYVSYTLGANLGFLVAGLMRMAKDEKDTSEKP